MTKRGRNESTIAPNFLPLETSDQAKLNPWVLDPLEIIRPKSETHGNPTVTFLNHPSKFHFVFN